MAAEASDLDVSALQKGDNLFGGDEDEHENIEFFDREEQTTPNDSSPNECSSHQSPNKIKKTRIVLNDYTNNAGLSNDITNESTSSNANVDFIVVPCAISSSGSSTDDKKDKATSEVDQPDENQEDDDQLEEARKVDCPLASPAAVPIETTGIFKGQQVESDKTSYLDDQETYQQPDDDIIVTQILDTMIRSIAINIDCSVGDSQLKCIACGFTSSLSVAMNRHMLKHDISDRYICTICQMVSFRMKTQLNYHIKILHKKESRLDFNYKCKVCIGRFSTEKLAHKHFLEAHQLATHGCPKCFATFNSEIDAINHQSSHNDQTSDTLPVKMINCQYCDFVAPDVGFYDRHWATNHDPANAFSCYYCKNFNFRSKNNLRRHIEYLHPEELVITELHQRVNSMDLPCVVCAASTRTITVGKLHLESHNMLNKPIFCKICRMCAFQTTIAHNAHRKQFHEPSETAESYSFKCKHCVGRFKTAEDLSNHNGYHDMTRKYLCTSCKVYFITEDDLKCHVLIHGDDAKDARTFPNQDRLMTRQRRTEAGRNWHSQQLMSKQLLDQEKKRSTEGGDTMEEEKRSFGKAVECKICKLAVMNEGVLKLHMVRHLNCLPYNCKICDYYFETCELLLMHKRLVHSGSNINYCVICLLVFDKPSMLSRSEFETHMSSHDTRRRWMCECCSRYFTDNISNLKKHVKKIHGWVAENTISQRLQEREDEEQQLTRSLDDAHPKLAELMASLVDVENKCEPPKRPVLKCYKCIFNGYSIEALLIHRYKAHQLPVDSNYGLPTETELEDFQLRVDIYNKEIAKIDRKLLPPSPPRIHRTAYRLKRTSDREVEKKSLRTSLQPKPNKIPRSARLQEAMIQQISDSQSINIVRTTATATVMNEKPLDLKSLSSDVANKNKTKKNGAELRKDAQKQDLTTKICNPQKGFYRCLGGAQIKRALTESDVKKLSQNRLFRQTYCPVCLKQIDNYKIQGETEKHLMIHVIKQFECTICPFTYYARPHDIKRHKKKHHPELFKDQETTKTCKSKTKITNCDITQDDDPEARHECPYCHRAIRLRSMKDHVIQLHTATKNTHRCGVCHKYYFNDTERMISHYGTVHHINLSEAMMKTLYIGGRKQTCKVCKKTFVDDEIDDHMMQHRDNSQRLVEFKCKFCKPFSLYLTNYEAVNLHMRAEHPFEQARLEKTNEPLCKLPEQSLMSGKSGPNIVIQID